MNAPVKDLKDILEAGTSLVFGTDLFIGLGPTSPDNYAALRDSGGRPPVAQYTYKYPTVQVYVRNNGYLAGYEQAETIQNCLHGIRSEIWNSTKYIQILASSEILYLGTDENGRAEFSLNFEIHRTKQN